MPELSRQTLRIDIDGDWTAEEFSTSFRLLNELYSLRAVIHIEKESFDELEMYAREFLDFPLSWRRFPRRLRALYLGRGLPFPPVLPPLIDLNIPESTFELLEPEERLRVAKIQFSSPGFKDLAGLGEVVGHLKDFILRLIELYASRRQRHLENELREEAIQAKRLENAKNLVELAKDCGYSKADMRKLVQWADSRQNGLITLIHNGKIRNANLLRENSERKG